MESLTSYCIHLGKLRSQAMKLSADAGYLAKIFDEEASRLHREEESSRLAALRSSILDRLNYEKRLESADSYAHSKATLVLTPTFYSYHIL